MFNPLGKWHLEMSEAFLFPEIFDPSCINPFLALRMEEIAIIHKKLQLSMLFVSVCKGFHA